MKYQQGNVLNCSSPIFCITHSQAQGLRHAGSNIVATWSYRIPGN
jgi:hypothetical protein